MSIGPFEEIINIYYDWEDRILSSTGSAEYRVRHKIGIMNFYYNERVAYANYESKMDILFCILPVDSEHTQEILSETNPRIELDTMLFFSQELFYIRNFQEDQTWLEDL